MNNSRDFRFLPHPLVALFRVRRASNRAWTNLFSALEMWWYHFYQCLCSWTFVSDPLILLLKGFLPLPTNNIHSFIPSTEIIGRENVNDVKYLESKLLELVHCSELLHPNEHGAIDGLARRLALNLQPRMFWSINNGRIRMEKSWWNQNVYWN